MGRLIDTGRFALEDVDVASAPYLVGTVTGLDDEVGDEDTAEKLSAAAVARQASSGNPGR